MNNKNKIKAYLAGAMGGLSFEEMNLWRVEARILLEDKAELLGKSIHCFNPVDFYNFNLKPNTYTEKEIKQFDLNILKTCDILLVNATNSGKSIGTSIEIELAHRWGIPTISFGDTTEVHPWVLEALDKQCRTLDEAVDYIADFYLANL
jgi:nucleoside 2-deoxyribosyltransferase